MLLSFTSTEVKILDFDRAIIKLHLNRGEDSIIIIISFTSTEVKILDFDRILFGYYYYYYYYFLFTFSVAVPYLKN